jgi:transcriptional regulator with XRE-family HTH domain
MVEVMEWPEILAIKTDGGERQAELAKQLNVKQQTISAWLSMSRYPEGQALASLAQLLEVDEADLVVAVHHARTRPKPRAREVNAEWRAEVETRLANVEALLAELRELQSRRTRPRGGPTPPEQ